MAVGIMGAVATAMAFDDMAVSPLKFQLMSWHKWLGVLVLIPWVPRLIASKKGYQPVSSTGWEDKLAHAVHLGMYALMLVVPLLGIAMSQAKGFPVVLFGIIPLPSIPLVTSDMAEWLEHAHGIGAWSLILLIVLHVVGAIKRQMSGEKVITQMISNKKEDVA